MSRKATPDERGEQYVRMALTMADEPMPLHDYTLPAEVMETWVPEIITDLLFLAEDHGFDAKTLIATAFHNFENNR